MWQGSLLGDVACALGFSDVRTVTTTGLDPALPEPRVVEGADDKDLDDLFMVTTVHGRCGGHAE